MVAARPSRRRAALVKRLTAAVEEVAAEFERDGLAPLSGGEWGPREILCHLVYWHEWYADVAGCVNGGTPVSPKVGSFPEFNRQSVVELGGAPVPRLVERLRRAQGRLGAELTRMSPHAKMTIKVGATGRGPNCFADRIEAHFRGHLRDIRRMRRRSGGAEPQATLSMTAFHRSSIRRTL